MKPQDIEDIYELSPLQQGILFHQLQSPGSRVYYVQATATLRGPLDEDALRRAWQHVVDRNPVLRTGFRWQELDKPLQIVHRHVAAAMTTCDWRLLPPAARRAQLDALAKSDRERDFELSAPPLVRLALIRTGDEEHELLWSHHHILMDGWSFNLLLSELAACYDAFARGEAYAAPLGPPYRRYVEWLQARDAARTAAFWRERLAGKTTPTRIAGVSRACRDLPGPPSGFEPVHVSPDVMARLRQASRHCRVTMNTMVLAAWSLVLRRHSGDSDVLFGVTVSGRSDSVAQAEWMIGLFINTVPVRIDVPATVPAAEWVRAIQARHSEAFEHAHAALVDIRRVSDISAGWPFFESLVVFERYPAGEQQGASGEARRLAIEPQSRWTEGGADYPLTLCVAETAEGLAGTLSYDAKAVDRALGVRLARHFERVLDSLAADPERRVADLEMLTPGEREHLLSPPAPLPAEASSLSDLFDAQVERTPDRLAVVDEQRGWTYGELNDAAARVVAALRRRGVGAESLVGIYAHRSVAMVAALLGTQKARAAFLPLDPTYPPERLRFMLDDAKAAVIITDRRLCDTLPAAAGAGTLVLDDLDAEATPSPAGEPVAAHPRHLAYVLYTSGSTGKPKGIAIEQGSAVAFMQWARATYDDAALAGVLATTSISYDCAIFEIFAPLCWGGTVILAASAMQLPADAGHATLASMLPSTLLAHLRAETLPRSLRAINVGGEFSPKDLCGELNRRQTSQLIYHVYGPAEDTTYSTFSLMRGDEASLVSIGKPLLGKAAYVLDADGSPAPIGVPGELHLSGLGLARGYCGKPDLTADRFIPNPFSAQPGARMYRTGDLARIRPDGELELLGRLDRQIKLRGARIEAREIEAVLEEHPAVEDAVVVAVQDATDETRLVAYVVAPRDQAPPDRATLRLFAKTRLPAAIVPSQFVFLREFVRMPNGKIDLRALPEPPPWQADARDNRRMAPRDDVELQLAQAWEELLGTSPVGVQDDFFELGGHSLKALALVSRIQRTFGRRIPFSALLDRGTVERLADLVRGGSGAAAQASLVRIKASGSRPPLVLVHPGRGSVFCYYELAQHLSRDFDVYGLQCRALDGQLPPHRTIEEMATDYLREIDGLAAGQPFVIAGWCMGGLVAFEMARQWGTTGRGAPALAILDSDAPTWPDACQPADDDVALLATFAEHLNLAWGASAPSLEELRTLPADRVLATVLEGAKKANAVPAGVSLAEAQILFDLFKTNCRAERDYTPSAYEGDVLLFRAVESIGGDVHEPDLGWVPFAGAGRLRVRDVPGNHHTMLHEPHVAALAGEVLGAVNAYAGSSPSM